LHIGDTAAGEIGRQVVDLSAMAGVSFATVTADASPSGANTVINFGGGEVITLDNVTKGNLTASNFLFAPEAAFAFTQPGEADTGQTAKIYLAMTGAFTVNTSGGAPVVNFTDGTSATYDAAATSSAGHVLVFDYTVASGTHDPNLTIASVGNSGAVKGANGQAVNFAPVTNQALNLQINPSPLHVSSVAILNGSSPVTGGSEVDAGTALTITLNMSESNFTINTSAGEPFLTLNNGETAIYAGLSGNEISFSYTVQPGDNISNLTIDSVQLGQQAGEDAVIQDSNGFPADFSGASNYATGIQIGPSLYVTAIGNDAPLNANLVGSEADPGTTVHLFVDMNTGITVSGSPVLTLSDGGTASYDSALSDLADGVLAFDYAVGSHDASPALAIMGVSGGTVTEASNNSIAANFSNISQIATGLQIGPSPLTVTGVSASTSGHVGVGATVFLTLDMSEASTVSLANPMLTLNDGETAFYDAADSNPSGKTLVFEYIVGDDIPDPNAANLAITGIDLGQNALADAVLGQAGYGATASVRDIEGYNADFSGAVGVPLGVQVGDPLSIGSFGTNLTTPEADPGQTFQIFLYMTEPATIDTTHGSPTLTLNDGAIATYDQAASNLASGKIAFDYTVGATDSTSILALTSVNPNGAVIEDAAQNAADVTLPPDASLNFTSGSNTYSVQIGPLSVSSLMTSQIGEVQTGQKLEIEINFGDPITVNTVGGSPTLTLSDGATATFDPTLNDAMAAAEGSLVFDYTPGSSDQSSNLEITKVNPNGATVDDTFNGTAVNFAGALNTPLDTSVNTGLSFFCFMPGTLIGTAGGAIAVEALNRGDMVITTTGASKPVGWIGRQTISTLFADPLRTLPIRIKAGALGETVPSRDLLVSPDHAILIDAVLIQAGALVNGTSIVRENNVPQTFTYYHVELDDHSLVLAENTPAETFIDNVERLGFDNWEEHQALYPDGKPIVEMPYPRAKAHRQVPRAIRQRLAERAALLGFDCVAAA
jgi:hypothetical protein